MATTARQQYFADETSIQKDSREFAIADDVQQKIDSIEEGAQVNTIETIRVNGTDVEPDQNKVVDLTIPDVIDNLSSTSTDDALSAKQGKVLYDKIQNIESRGRFLSNWNCATGLPVTNPTESPYIYRAGDYYSVSNVAASGGTNYRPDGSSYIISQASTTVETDVVNVSDFYLYDGTTWLLLVNTARQIAIDSSLSTTSTNPVENRVITNALNNKQNILTAGNHINITNNIVSTIGLQEKLTAGENITIVDVCTTESDMKGPCPKGFHVPTDAEWQNLYGILTTTFGLASNGNTMKTYLKMPLGGCRRIADADTTFQDTFGYYWSSSYYNTNKAISLIFYSTSIAPSSSYYTSGYSIRPFKNTPEVPDSSWTTLYDGSSIASNAGAFHNATLGLISVSGDGTTWYTIQDKNLGATTVYNSGDTLSEANCGGYFQWGNNYMFPYSGSVTTSSTRVDASIYGPGNYYSSSTFITGSQDWSNPQNNNLRGGVTQGTFQDCDSIVSATDTTYTASDFDIKDLTDSTSLRNTWDGKVAVSTDTGNELSSGAKIWLGTTTDFSSIVTPDSNTMYIQYVSSGGGGWQPGVNTVAYYPLDTDFNDASGNNRNLTNSGVEITTQNGIKCGYWNGSSYAQYTGFALGNTARTINLWTYCIGAGTQGLVHISPYTTTPSGSLGVKFNLGNTNVGPGDWYNASAESVTANVVPGWHNIVVTQTGATTKLYVDKNLIGTISDYPNQGISPTGWSLGCKFASHHSEKLTGYMSAVILEDKVWTAQEISDYYDQTKGDYGIS